LRWDYLPSFSLHRKEGGRDQKYGPGYHNLGNSRIYPLKEDSREKKGEKKKAIDGTLCPSIFPVSPGKRKKRKGETKVEDASARPLLCHLLLDVGRV